MGDVSESTGTVPISDAVSVDPVSQKYSENAVVEGDMSGVEEDDSDDPESDSSEDEEPSVENPSTDIRGDLEKALEGDLAKAFKGSYSFSRAYPTAPNPGLYLLPNDIGAVGLPLHKRDAAAVISGCRQAPFGQGERTVVDTVVRDTWEMNANQVQCLNPAWNGYLQGVVRDVCAELGVNVAASQPRCELYKLLLYETGSHFLPHVDTEKADGMFATIIIVLPSKYTGGAAHVSHGLLSTVYDTAVLSDFQTTVLAWYTDVMHEIKPITSGYRLALSYNLVHTSNALRPSLPNNHAAVNALRHVLLSWKQANHDRVPRMILYLLDHKYSQANLSGSALKGVDAHKLAILDALAQQLGFQLGMASVECRLQGAADDDGCNYHRRKRAYYYDDYDDSDNSVDPDDVGFLEVYEREASVTNLVTLDGVPLQDDLAYDKRRDHTIPRNLMDQVEAGPHDDQEYEGYMGNGAGSLERWYRRTVLVIWPEKFSLDMTFDDEISEAIDDLSVIDSTRAHKRERKLAEFLLNVAKNRENHRVQIAETLCNAACAWEDLQLYERAMAACEASVGVRLLSNDVIYESITTFGFGAMRSFLQKMLRSERSNFQRFQFIDELQNWFSTQPTLSEEGVDAWVIDQRRFAMEHLEKPGPDDSQVLVDLALRNGGFHVIRDIFVPQFKADASVRFLTAMVAVLQTERAKAGVSVEDQSILTSLVADLLSSAIAKANLFATATTTKNSAIKSNLMTPHTAARLIELCIGTRNDELVEKIAQRLTDVANIDPAVVKRRVLEVLLPLLPLVDAKVKARAAGESAITGVQNFYEATIELCLRFVLSGTRPVPSDLTLLLDACVVCGGIDILHKKVWPALKASKPQSTTYTDFIEQLQKRRDRLLPSSCGVSVESVITEAVRQAVLQANFTAYTPPVYSYYASGNKSHENCSTTLELLRLCLTTGNKPCCSLVFKRLLDSQFHRQDYIENVLIPFLPELRQFLTTNRVALSAEPFNSAFKSIVMLWASKVLGPKPSETGNAVIARMRNHGCKCAHCVQVFKFLTSSGDRTSRLERIGAPKRKHLEQELSKYAKTAATWSMISGSPQGLMVTKGDSIYLPVKWNATHARGAAILTSISSNATELQRIFGADHHIIMDMMAGRVITNPAASSSRDPGSSASSSVSAGPVHAVSGSSASVAATASGSNPSSNSSRAHAAPHASNSIPSSSQAARKRKRDNA